MRFTRPSKYLFQRCQIDVESQLGFELVRQDPERRTAVAASLDASSACKKAIGIGSLVRFAFKGGDGGGIATCCSTVRMPFQRRRHKGVHKKMQAPGRPRRRRNRALKRIQSEQRRLGNYCAIDQLMTRKALFAVRRSRRHFLLTHSRTDSLLNKRDNDSRRMGTRRETYRVRTPGIPHGRGARDQVPPVRLRYARGAHDNEKKLSSRTPVCHRTANRALLIRQEWRGRRQDLFLRCHGNRCKRRRVRVGRVISVAC